ncbi:MAG: hypothetical protein RRY36_06705 [Bacteroidaceae bacterium]
MKQLLSLLLIGILWIGVNFFSSCDEEKFTTNPSHTLAFSQDTIMFDTIFTTIGSSTRILKIYNPNAEAMRISSIALARGNKSVFRVNVDGQYGTNFSDVEIREKDSMYVFVEVTINPNNVNNPILEKDSLVFNMANGPVQDVKLRAYGQDILPLRGKVIDKDTVFTSLRPIVIYDSLRVNQGVTLKIDEGTRMYFHSKADCRIYGTMQAKGTLDKPILLRGDRLDNMFDDLPYDRVAGQWAGVRFFGNSYHNMLSYVDIHGGEYGIQCDSSEVGTMKLTLENSIVHNVKSNGLNFTSCKAKIGNCQLTNAGANCVNLLGGDVEFIHCTIANFYSWDIRRGVAVAVKNTQFDKSYPLINARFLNCLITGSSSDEISGVASKDQTIPFNYYYSYSLLNTKEESNENIVAPIWKREDKFLYIGKTDFDYDFRLDTLSAAIDISKVEDAQSYPLDLRGRNRLADKSPDAGCYEWKSGDKKRK